MSGSRNETLYGENIDFSGKAIPGPTITTDGQLLVGSTSAPNIRPGFLTSTDGSVTITPTAPDADNMNIDLSASVMSITITSLDNTDSPYTVLSTDVYMSCDVTSGVLTIELPDAPSTERVFYVKDAAGNSAANNITITTVGGVVTIDGATSFVMNTDFESVSLIFNGTSYEVF